MRGTAKCRGWVVAAAGLVALGARGARGQDAGQGEGPGLDAAAARAAAARFLTEGEDAPRPGMAAAALARLEAHAVVDPVHGPAWELIHRTRDGALLCVVRVERTEGRVLYFCQPDAESVVAALDAEGRPRPPAEARAEAEARAHFTRAELEALARRHLARLVGDLAARPFRLVAAEAERGPGLLVDRFTFEEAPGPGVLACYPNPVVIDLSPETGEVVSLLRTDVRHALRAPPAVDAAAAERRARSALPAAGALQATTLRVVLDATGPRAIWLVTFRPTAAEGAPGIAAVCAATGEVLGAQGGE